MKTTVTKGKSPAGRASKTRNQEAGLDGALGNLSDTKNMDRSVYTSLTVDESKDVRRHIKASDQEPLDGQGDWKTEAAAVQRHNDLKTQEGGYDTEFEGDVVERKPRRTEDHRRTSRMAGLR